MKFLYKDSSLVSEDKIAETSVKLSPRMEALVKCSKCTEYSHPEDFLHFPIETSDAELAKKITKERGAKLKCVCVVGIGGANLGAQAVTLALRYIVPTGAAKLLYFDTPDPYFLKHFKANVSGLESKEEFLVLIISKSGETLETLANAKIVTSIIEEKFSSIEDRIVVLSLQGSPLWNAYGESVEKIPLRKNISDRYSIFSIIGLLPLSLGGMDIEALLDGAREALPQCLSTNSEENPALQSVSLVDFHYQKGIHIRDFFYFVPELEFLGKCSRQLVAESLGKGGEGITPTVSIGTTDLHSMAQLYIDGPKDRFTSFVSIGKIPEFDIKESKIISGLEVLKGKSIYDLQCAIYKAYTDSYRSKQIPFSQMLLKDLSEHSLGMYMQYLMVETVLLADLWKVDAFNQPGVEEYKKNSRKALK